MPFAKQVYVSLAFLLSCTCVLAVASDVKEPTYNEHIRPIFADHCFACHGSDPATREAGLRLDIFEEAVDFGAIVPGKSTESEMIRRIDLDASSDERMPPASHHKELKPEERELLRRWVDAGAKYEAHWSFSPLEKPEAPSSMKQWSRNPIDSFIAKSLEKVGLTPAPEADRASLARRLSLDLTGLPPTAEEVNEFVNSKDPAAYDNYVNRLFATPQYAEHRTRFWLDYARYADTHGLHFDNYRETWAYRDWLIKSFASNQRYNEFVRDQIAGDLLPNRTLDQQVATGFVRCNATTNEGGIIDEEYAMLYARDRTETFSTVFMGLTAGCAVCHDHKFDPFTMKDFYSLSAFFSNTTQPVKDGNVPNTPPTIVVPADPDREEWLKLSAAIDEVKAKLAPVEKEARDRYATDSATWQLDRDKLYADMPNRDLLLHLPLAEGAGRSITGMLKDHLETWWLTKPLNWEGKHGPTSSILFSKSNEVALSKVADWDRDSSFTTSAWVYLPRRDAKGAILAKCSDKGDQRGWDLWVDGNRPSFHLNEKWPDSSIKVMSVSALPAKQWIHLTATYDGSGKAAGVRIFVNGKEANDIIVRSDNLVGSIRNDEPLTIASRKNGSAIDGISIQDVRLYDRALDAQEISKLHSASLGHLAIATEPDKRTPEQNEAIFVAWAKDFAPEYTSIQSDLMVLEDDAALIRQRGTIAHVMQERNTPAEAYILTRGEYDMKAERVVPEVPAFLGKLPDDAPRNRASLVQWLFQPRHPLTSRVAVNRIWQEIFGTGLVKTTGDFGVTGDLPSNPELLDWLACEYEDSGWDTQHLIRLIVTSSAYRQSAEATPLKLEIDPENRLLSRSPRYRLDAEVVRDYALAASGLLVRKIGGPSVRPYQPEGVWEAVAIRGSDTGSYKAGEGDDLYRRSMYTIWKRSAPPASMEILNAPSREMCVVQRERSNTPIQALATLNDPQLIEAARHLATSLLCEFRDRPSNSDDPANKREKLVEALTLRIWSRLPTDEERKVLLDSYSELYQYYERNVDLAEQLLSVGASSWDKTLPAAECAAWMLIAHELFNTDEALCR